MENYIQITKLNDFIFCPKSLYFHGLFENFEQKTYHSEPQTVGKIVHESIEAGDYSTSKYILQATNVYSEKYGLCGKIDVFDTQKGILIERKYRIKKIYDGFKYQLFAQMFCLEEMGYKVNELYLYSKVDNKKYPIELPTAKDKEEFQHLVDQINHFNIAKDEIVVNEEKCNMCIYKPLCH